MDQPAKGHMASMHDSEQAKQVQYSKESADPDLARNGSCSIHE
jgi:hypothetical protein